MGKTEIFLCAEALNLKFVTETFVKDSFHQQDRRFWRNLICDSLKQVYESNSQVSILISC